MKSLFEQIEIKLPEVKPDNYHDFQKIGKEMTKYFGTPCYFLFSRFQHQKIIDAFAICQKNKNTSVKYLIGIIRNLK